MSKEFKRWFISGWRLTIYLGFISRFRKNLAGEIIFENKEEKETTDWNVQLRISGNVQEVGFRFVAVQLAERLHLTGIVRNQMDGTVYAEVSGRSRKVETFIKQLALGPTPEANVDKIMVNFDEKIEEKVKFLQTD